MSIAALVAAAVRVLPWLLDPALPVEVAEPFAKSLVTLALEASLLTGWPLGWAVAMQRFSERGESRVLLLLGESPRKTIGRLLPQGAVFFALLFAVSFAGGDQASAPGRVVNELLEKGKSACAASEAPRAYSIPFVDLAWLCPGNAAHTNDGNHAPRLFGRPGGAMGPVGATITAADIDVSGDLRRIDLADARLFSASAEVHVGRMHVRGLLPFARASALPPWLRATVLGLSALLSAGLASFAMLRARVSGGLGRIYAGALGGVGPLTALLAMRLLEQRLPDAPTHGELCLFAVVPLFAALAVVLAARVRTLAPRARRW